VPSSSTRSQSLSDSLSTSSPYFFLYKDFTSSSLYSSTPIVTRPLPNVPIHGMPSESSKSHSISDSLSTSLPYFSLYIFFTSSSFFSSTSIVAAPLPTVHVHSVPSSSTKSSSLSDSLSTSWPYFSLYIVLTSSSFFSSAPIVAGPLPTVQIHGVPSESSMSHSLSDSLSTSWPYFSLYKFLTSSSLSWSTAIVRGPQPTVQTHGVPSSSINSSSLCGLLSTSWPYFSLYKLFNSSSLSSSTAIVNGPQPTVQVHSVPS